MLAPLPAAVRSRSPMLGGPTPLMGVAWSGKVEVARRLLAADREMTIADHLGQRADNWATAVALLVTGSPP